MSANQLGNADPLENWVDAVDQENRNSAQKRVEIIKDGIKTVIDYVDDEDGSRSKVITTYKVIHKKVPRVVADRKKWKKFGASRDDEPGPNIATTYVADDVEIQFVNRFGEKQDEFEEKADPMMKGQKGSHCRFCKSDDHWSVTCPYKEMFAGLVEEEQQEGADSRGGAVRMPGGGPNRYIPPSQRNGPAGERVSMTGEHRSEDYTVRITNLPEDSDTLDDDLRTMFGRAGRIVRFYLARDKNTLRPKGFAFVTFATAMDAEKAIEQFNGEKMEHLILKVEWTKPST